uniref:Uncharacterized protein n=1 Tax=Oryza meridionalis TaxID=40149 RepID=A0A0E0CST8_9ORYZ
MAEKRLLLPVALAMMQKHGGGERVWAQPWRSSSRAGDASFVEAVVAQARMFDFRSSLVDLLTVSAARALLILSDLDGRRGDGDDNVGAGGPPPTPPASVALPIALPVGSSSSVLWEDGASSAADEAAAPRYLPPLLDLNLPASSPSSSDNLKATASPLDTERRRKRNPEW